MINFTKVNVKIVLTVIVYLLTLIPLISSQKKEGKICHPSLTVDITNGTKNSLKHINHNDVIYKPSDYYSEVINGTTKIRGCLCNIHNCIRKCCAFGEVYRSFKCVDSNNSLATNVLPVHEGQNETQVPEGHFKFVIGKYCLHNAYNLDPEQFAFDVHFLQKNGTLFFPITEAGTPEYRTQENYCYDYDDVKNATVVLACFMNAEEIMDTGKLYSIGMLISMPFLLVTFLVYACVPELQNIHGKCLMCYVASLLFALIFLVSVQLHTGEVDPAYCVAAPCIVYFFFMVSFMWLNVMCIDICWTFSGRRGFKGIRNSERKRFVIYNIYAWGIPLIMLIITVALQVSENLPSYIIRPNFGVGRCWFKDDSVVGYYFYGPIILIILVNCGLFIYTAAKIYLVQRDTDQSMKQESSQRHGKETDQQRYKLYLKLMMVFGINWSMEIISWAISGPAWLWYVTDMFNALYGVLIFFIFVCKANVWKLVRKRYYVMQGKPMQAQAFGPTSSTRSTAMSNTVTSGTGGNGPDSFALTSSNTT